MRDRDEVLYSHSYVNFMLEQYRHNRDSVSVEWQQFFDGIDDDGVGDIEDQTLKSHLANIDLPQSGNLASAKDCVSDKAMALIDAYRAFGALAANLDPLGLNNHKADEYDVLRVQNYMAPDELVDIGGYLDLGRVTGAQLVDKLQAVYCGKRAIEYAHISNLQEREWLRKAFEGLSVALSDSQIRKKIHKDMLESELFEHFLHVKFAGAKRFSIEGGETSMVVFEALLEAFSELGCDEFVIGMPHRGRLNCLVKIVGKEYSYIISEFMDSPLLPNNISLSGDVKYHLGASVDRQLSNGKKVCVSLTPNPSHLEAVCPVVLGRVKAKQVMRGGGYDKVVGIISHGDSSFCGQGVVYESLQLSNVDGYSVGGSIHIIVNNQIGFTTEPKAYSSSRYPSDIAKFAGMPILHVNGDDPESAYLLAKLAAEYRTKFGKDVVINIVCYRKYGHNEGDEPMFTQPIMYKRIHSRPSPLALYEDKLVSDGVMTKTEAEKAASDFKSFLDRELSVQKDESNARLDWLTKQWIGIKFANDPFISMPTGVSTESISSVVAKVFDFPVNFAINPKLAKLLEARSSAFKGETPLDWGSAEWLAFATLMLDGYSVRVSGQDAIRGTFSHRHAVMFDSENNAAHGVFTGLCLADQGVPSVRFDIMSSPLSEYGVLGFEYGYSSTDPNTLTIWEAQYGDFANGAQIIFDQFLSSAELKWLRMSGLVVLLPHGYEGQGPEHSSARVERFLQVCAENNMRVVNCTTPANYFHALRRQMIINVRKPLIVFSPKSLLRHKSAVSTIDEFTGQHTFQPIIGDNSIVKADTVSSAVLCSGKIYYDLFETRGKKQVSNVPVIRIEQLYPLNTVLLADLLSVYPNLREIVWCQEEPKNMGPWLYMLSHLLDIAKTMGVSIRYAGRKESAATAVGYHSVHTLQQATLLDGVFA